MNFFSFFDNFSKNNREEIVQEKDTKEEKALKKRIFYDKVFYFSMLFFAMGVALANIFSNKSIFIDYFTLIFSFFIFLFLAIYFYHLAKKEVFQINLKNYFQKKKKNWFQKGLKKAFQNFWVFFLWLLFFIFGLTFSQNYLAKNIGHYDHVLGKKVTAEVIVADEVLEKSFYSKVTATIESEKYNDKVIFKAPKFPLYQYGDKLLVEGYLVKIKNFKNKKEKKGDTKEEQKNSLGGNGREFDYINFLKKDGVFYEVKSPKIKYVSSGNGNKVKEKLFTLKKNFLGRIKKLIPDPESSLLGGLVLGAKENMDKETLEDFRRTGVIHIVVLSGYNLTIVAEFIMAVLAFMGFTASALLGSVAIVLFAIMTGASATIVRGAIMALIVIGAKLSGRESEAIKALFLAGFLMLLWNPMILLYDPSFQLSFLATLGLLIFSPFIERFLEKSFFFKIFFKKNIFAMRTLVAATLATSAFVAPLLLYMMGEISIISPLVNLLVLAFVPFTMLFGFLAVLLSYFWDGGAMILAFLSYIFLHYDILLTGFFSKLSFATVRAESFSFGAMTIVYLFYIFVFWVYRKFFKFRKF